MAGGLARIEPAGDSPKLTGQELSATVPPFEALRVAAGIGQADIAAAAGVGERSYRRALADPSSVRPATLAKINAAARRLAAPAKPRDDGALVDALFALALALVSETLGVRPEDVRAQDHRRGATADPVFRRLALARQATLYVLNQFVAHDAVRQHRLAELTGLTRAGVCLAIRAIENRRDGDPDLDALLCRCERLITGETS